MLMQLAATAALDIEAAGTALGLLRPVATPVTGVQLVTLALGWLMALFAFAVLSWLARPVLILQFLVLRS